jgi:hypothetical protein
VAAILEEGRRKKEEGRGGFEIGIGTPTQNGDLFLVGVLNPLLPD